MMASKNCSTCKAELIPDPSPDMRENLICVECDFTPEAIKKFYQETFGKMPRYAIRDIEDVPGFPPKQKPIFEPKSEMNPYLRDVLALVDGDQSALRDNMFGTGIKYGMLLSIARQRYVYKYAWAIPCKRALEVIAQYSPIVEVGAGSGYWASLLAQIGTDVVAYDISSTKQYKGSYNHFHKHYFAVKKGSESAIKDHADRALFLCWPPYNDKMAFNTLKQYRGETVLYVGEGKGGCTASDSFFNLLTKNFSEEESVEIPVWFGIHDRLFVFKR